MYNQNLQRFSFDRDKALEVILYVSSKVKDLYHLLKIIYFADKKHLSLYGRFISGDSYIAMNNGPVPSQSYDILKGIRGDGIYSPSENEKKSIRVFENNVISERVPDLKN